MKLNGVIVAGCGLIVTMISPRLKPHDYKQGYSRDPLVRVEANQSSLAKILGEFRTGMSDMLFIKTERYLHSGVGYVPHLEEKLLTVEGTAEGVAEHLEGVHDHSHGHGHSHFHDEEDHFHHEEEIETLLPRNQHDYRGWIGRMHREVKPWRDPDEAHQHTDGKELIPWFRMMTVSDPHYIRGYIVGAFWVQQHDRDAALGFIEEGLAYNPDAFQLHLSKGFMLMRNARRLAQTGVKEEANPEQMKLLLQARESFLIAAEQMELQRPLPPEAGDFSDLPEWGYYLENDAMASAYMAVLFEKRYGDPEMAESLRLRYLKLIPEHPQLRSAWEKAL